VAVYLVCRYWQPLTQQRSQKVFYLKVSAIWQKHHPKWLRTSASQQLKQEKWNRGKIPMLLTHPASSGHGLNLQGGSHIIVWFGLNWSLELYKQLNGRLYRQGQKSKSVIIHHIIAKGTVDERVLKVLTMKDATQEELMLAVKAA
jgi:SNF2 family DNA or RNA helicase